MKIIDQSYKIISLPENILSMIEAAGRTCYKSEDKIGCTEAHEGICADVKFDAWGNGCLNSQCSAHSSVKFVGRMRDRGHHAMIEFGDIIVRFVTNRGVTHELVRHRLFSFAQESTRYVRYDGRMEFIRPCWWEDSTTTQQIIWKDALLCAERHYKELLDFGWRPEQSREVLPNSLKTEIVVKGNIREWRHCLQLRTSKKAHPQIRALMLPLLAELKERVPVLFNDIEAV
jgi:thymidylate synthase (FAD)